MSIEQTYYEWHQDPKHHQVHWSIFLAVAVLVTVFLVGQISLTYNPKQAEAATSLLKTSDLTCAGMFITPWVQYQGYTSYYPMTMRYENGNRHYFMYDGTGHIVEFPEPTLSPCNTSLAGANRAHMESWGGDWGAFPVSEAQDYIPGNGNASTGAFGLLYDDTINQLVLNWTGTYSNSGYRNTFAAATLNSTNHTLNVQGCWGLNNRNTLYTGGLTVNIPPSFANTYLPGAHWAVGVAGPLGQAAQDSYGPTLIAIPQPTPNPCAPHTNNLIPLLKVLAEYPANGIGPTCFIPNSTGIYGCTPTQPPTPPYPAQMSFNQYSNTTYPEGWTPYAGHGWYTFGTAGSIGWYDDGIKGGVVVPTEVMEGWANPTILANPAPSVTNNGANGTMYLSSVSTNDGNNMNVGDLIWVKTCTVGVDGPGCFVANGNDISFAVIDAVDPSTNRVDYHNAGYDSGTGNHAPVPGGLVYFGSSYFHGSPSYSRGTYRLQVYDPAQYAEVIAGTRLPYNVRYDTEMDLTTLVKGFGCPSCAGGGVKNQGIDAHNPVSTITDPAAHQIMIAFKGGDGLIGVIANAVYVFNTGSNSVTPPTAPQPSPVAPSPSTPSPSAPPVNPISSTPVPGSGVSDNFDRADATSLGSNWSTMIGGFDIINNTADQDVISTYETESVWAANTFNADQYSQATVASVPAYGEDPGVIVRASGRQDSRKAYIYSVDNAGKGKIDKVINGTFSTLVQNLSTISQGDVMKLQVVGTTLTAYKNGVLQATVTDSNIANGQPGIFIYGAFHQITRLDNWSANNTTPTSTPAPSPAPTPAPTPSPITVPLAGDLNNDNIVNSLDWSIMSAVWFTSNSAADLNHDGIVNSIDFSILNRNWFRTGS
ncbi:MAG: dockerin type I domain-containing protein [Patescibacteria group bacterium]